MHRAGYVARKSERGRCGNRNGAAQIRSCSYLAVFTDATFFFSDTIPHFLPAIRQRAHANHGGCPSPVPPPDFARLCIAGEADHRHVAPPTVQRILALACPALPRQPALFTVPPFARPPSRRRTGPFVLDPVYLSQGEILFSFTLLLIQFQYKRQKS